MAGRLRRFVAAAALLAALVAPASALADPPACPDAPAAYTGTDDTLAALTDLRADTRASCLAQTARLDQLDADTTAAAAQGHTDAGNVRASVDALTGNIDATTAAVAALPTPAAAAGYDGPSAADFDSASAAAHGDAWALLGFGAFLVFGLPLLRLITPFLRPSEAA
jgi:hypothetical protein